MWLHPSQAIFVFTPAIGEKGGRKGWVKPAVRNGELGLELKETDGLEEDRCHCGEDEEDIEGTVLPQKWQKGEMQGSPYRVRNAGLALIECMAPTNVTIKRQHV